MALAYWKLDETRSCHRPRSRIGPFNVEPELTAKILKRDTTIFEASISYTGRTRSEGKKISLGGCSVSGLDARSAALFQPETCRSLRQRAQVLLCQHVAAKHRTYSHVLRVAPVRRHQQLNAERMNLHAVRSEFVRERMPRAIRQGVPANNPPVYPDRKVLRRRDLGCPANVEGETRRVRWQVEDSLKSAPSIGSIGTVLDVEEAGLVLLKLRVEVTSRLEDRMFKAPRRKIGDVPVDGEHVQQIVVCSSPVRVGSRRGGRRRALGGSPDRERTPTRCDRRCRKSGQVENRNRSRDVR